MASAYTHSHRQWQMFCLCFSFYICHWNIYGFPNKRQRLSLYDVVMVTQLFSFTIYIQMETLFVATFAGFVSFLIPFHMSVQNILYCSFIYYMRSRDPLLMSVSCRIYFVNGHETKYIYLIIFAFVDNGIRLNPIGSDRSPFQNIFCTQSKYRLNGCHSQSTS